MSFAQGVDKVPEKGLVPKKAPDKNLLDINLQLLEDECRANPQLTFLWGKELAKARKRVKETKNRIKLREAEIGQEVRENPGEYHLERVTEKALDHITIQDNEYKHLQNQLIDSEYEEDILDAFFKAVADRKQQLTNEVSLHGQMYWSKVGLGNVEGQERVAAAEGAAARVKEPKKRKSEPS